MSRRQRWILIAAAALLTLAAFFVQFPAALLARALPAEAALVQVEGSLWNGSAAALGISGVVAQEKLTWHFEPGALLHGQLAWRVQGESRGTPGQARVVLGFKQSGLEQVNLTLPLDALTRFHPTIAGVRVGGALRVESERLARGAPIAATLTLSQVSSAMGIEPVALGSYLLRVQADEQGKGSMNAETQSGSLAVTGQGSFELARKAVSVSLRFKPSGELPGLAPLLATLPREGDQYRLDWSRP